MPAKKLCPICGNELSKGQTYCSKICEDMGALEAKKQEGAPLPSFEKTKAKLDRVNKEIAETGSPKASKDKTTYPGWKKLSDYVDSIWPEKITNWALYSGQAKDFMRIYGLTCDDIGYIIVYAIKYAGHVINPDAMLAQFIPRYLMPAMEMKAKILENRKMAEDMPDDEIIKGKTNESKTNPWIKLEDF